MIRHTHPKLNLAIYMTRLPIELYLDDIIVDMFGFPLNIYVKTDEKADEKKTTDTQTDSEREREIKTLRKRNIHRKDREEEEEERKRERKI